MLRTIMDDCRRLRANRAVARKSLRPIRSLLPLLTLVASAGCTIVPRPQFDECKQLARTLRSENARLKDQVLALQSQNRDYADRAVDDSRRLTAQDEAIERLEVSVQDYQKDRDRLEAAYKQLAASLGGQVAGGDQRAATNRGGVAKLDARADDVAPSRKRDSGEASSE
jgi:hypothetical protein